MNLLGIERKLLENTEQASILKRNYERNIDVLAKENKELNRLKELYMSGRSMELVEIAESVLVFDKGFSKYHGPTIIRAQKDIATRADVLRVSYFGTKDYAHFRGQEITCSYGMGPTHGYVTFSVGLSVTNRGLTELEREACMYYLNMLADEKFRENAKIPW